MRKTARVSEKTLQTLAKNTQPPPALTPITRRCYCARCRFFLKHLTKGLASHGWGTEPARRRNGRTADTRHKKG